MNKALIFVFGFACVSVLGGCTTSAPPPVTPELARTGARQHVDVATLRRGRTLFVSRCIECHTLPVVSRYSSEAWPHLVDKMAARADLKAKEREAVIAYIVAVRSSM